MEQCRANPCVFWKMDNKKMVLVLVVNVDDLLVSRNEIVGKELLNVLMYVCVCMFSSHLFWTSSSLDVRAGVTQEEGHTGFLMHLLSAVRALIFSREDFSRSFPSSTVKSNFVY